ncbi:hypothetical protein U1Q18_003675 [Sarracenia purpurea var. burkii]
MDDIAGGDVRDDKESREVACASALPDAWVTEKHSLDVLALEISTWMDRAVRVDDLRSQGLAVAWIFLHAGGPDVVGGELASPRRRNEEISTNVVKGLRKSGIDFERFENR